MSPQSIVVDRPDVATGDSDIPAGALLAVLDQLGQGVLVLEGVRVIEANAAFCAMVGRNLDELRALPTALRLVPVASQGRLRRLLRRYLAGERVERRLVLPVTANGGRVISLDLAMGTIAGPGNVPRLVILANDVTQHRSRSGELQFQKRLLEAISESAIDAILVVDNQGRILYFNHHFVDLWQIPDEVIARRRDNLALAAVMEKLVDPDAFLSRVQYLYAHPHEESHDELRMRDGRTIDRYTAAVLDERGAPRARVWFFRDVTGEMRDRQVNELLALSGELFGASLDVESTLSQLAQLVVPRLADWAAVDVVDETENYQRTGVAHVEPGGDELLRELHERYPLKPSQGHLRGRVVTTREPIALYDADEQQLRDLARDEEHFEMLQRLGIRSALWVPLVVRDRVVGVLSVGYSTSARRYRPADLELMRELARRAALALDNALLYRAVRRGETRQTAVAELGQLALTGVPFDDLSRAAAQMLATIMDVPLVEVLRLMPDRRRLLLVGGVGWKPGMVGSATVRAGLGSQGGYTLATIGPVIVDNLETETRFRPPALMTGHGVVSGLTVVIGGSPNPFGVLGTHTNRHRIFAEDDISFVQAMANVLAAAIERQENENRLDRMASAEQARAAQLKAVIESIGDAVVVFGPQGRVLLANPAAHELLAERLENGLEGVLGAFEWPSTQEVADLTGGEAIELRMPPALAEDGQLDDEEQWLELSAFPVLPSDETQGAGGGTVLVLRDVTAARNARTVREAFLGMLSHELRTPVTTIYGGSEMLARRSESIGEEERRSVYEDIRAESDRLLRLVENLLVLSRVERQGLLIDTEPVLIQRLVPRIVEAESERWPDARFEVDVRPRLPPVAAEQTYLEQILRNLLSNAAKYGGPGLVVVRAEGGTGVVRVTVRDDGPGFPPAESRRLFDLFYRTPSAVKQASGAGIGLFVSRQLINAMGGRIWAANRAEGGSEFGFELPVFEEQP
jgi:PAS domain S-box-containing protein